MQRALKVHPESRSRCHQYAAHRDARRLVGVFTCAIEVRAGGRICGVTVHAASMVLLLLSVLLHGYIGLRIVPALAEPWAALFSGLDETWLSHHVTRLVGHPNRKGT